MSKLAPMDRPLTSINGSLARAEERFAPLGCASKGRARQISVHAPRTTLIDTDWDTIGDCVEEPTESRPIPSTVRQIANPALPTTPAGIEPLEVVAVAPKGGCATVVEPLRQQDRKRNPTGSLLPFIAGLVAGIGITVGLSIVTNAGYRLHQDQAQEIALISAHAAPRQVPESERGIITNSAPEHLAPTAPGVPASRPDAMGTQPSNSPNRGDDSVQPGPSGKLDAPPVMASSQPSESVSKQVRTAVPQSTRRVTRVRRPKPVVNDNPY